jgi:Tol biopolymer transport system component
MNHKSLHGIPRIILITLAIVSIFITGCAPAPHYPKIMTLGFVDGGFEISVLDLSNSIRQYVTNSHGIAPTSYSYCEAKKQVAFSAFAENGQELIFMDLTNFRNEALTHGNNDFRLPVWSPDCSMLAFTSFAGNPNVLLFNLENSQTPPAISEPGISSQDASWSPDSYFLATYIPVPPPDNNQQRFDLGIVDIKTNKLATRINGSIAYTFSGVAWSSDSNKK